MVDAVFSVFFPFFSQRFFLVNSFRDPEPLPIQIQLILSPKTGFQLYRRQVPKGLRVALNVFFFFVKGLGLSSTALLAFAAQVHEGCVARVSEGVCTLGRHRRLILPPIAVLKNQPPRRKGRLAAGVHYCCVGYDAAVLGAMLCWLLLYCVG